jgi:hypothetical protein
MNALQIVTLIIFALEFVASGVGLLCVYLFFDAIEKKHELFVLNSIQRLAS